MLFVAVMLTSSVVVHDFNVAGSVVCPAETDPPLGVDPDAVLPCAVAPQYLEAVASQYGVGA